MTSTSNKNEKIIDELTISEDFNLGLSGEQVFPEAAISNKKPSETEWFRIYGSTRKDIEKVYCVKVMVDDNWENNLFLAAIKSLRRRVANDFKKRTNLLGCILHNITRTNGYLGPVSQRIFIYFK